MSFFLTIKIPHPFLVVIFTGFYFLFVHHFFLSRNVRDNPFVPDDEESRNHRFSDIWYCPHYCRRWKFMKRETERVSVTIECIKIKSWLCGGHDTLIKADSYNAIQTTFKPTSCSYQANTFWIILILIFFYNNNLFIIIMFTIMFLTFSW